MTTREDFEKELLKQFKHDQGMIAFNESAGEYVDWQAQTQWTTWQACAAHYEAELLKRDALIAEKDKALREISDHAVRISLTQSMLAETDVQVRGIAKKADEALSLTHDSVRLVEVAEMKNGEWVSGYFSNDMTAKLYTIVKGEEG